MKDSKIALPDAANLDPEQLAAALQSLVQEIESSQNELNALNDQVDELRNEVAKRYENTGARSVEHTVAVELQPALAAYVDAKRRLTRAEAELASCRASHQERQSSLELTKQQYDAIKQENQKLARLSEQKAVELQQQEQELRETLQTYKRQREETVGKQLAEKRATRAALQSEITRRRTQGSHPSPALESFVQKLAAAFATAQPCQ
eukprot:TRINITY_DN5076_c0_g1_i1.p1 TRINITY_DN5076_c0_g1~~TRINITY_DN5076_c0_g1_i1.p1  ORF type:complete len:207 (+),score=50.40 TRINITY_DN5076_c0_g1_i1:20-640(+)